MTRKKNSGWDHYYIFQSINDYVIYVRINEVGEGEEREEDWPGKSTEEATEVSLEERHKRSLSREESLQCKEDRLRTADLTQKARSYG